MFNLEQSIAEWRQRMLAAGIKSPVPLEELEAHLRDEIERQMESGLDEQAAFGSAVREIGHAGELKSEFKKIGGMKDFPKLSQWSLFWTGVSLLALTVIEDWFMPLILSLVKASGFYSGALVFFSYPSRAVWLPDFVMFAAFTISGLVIGFGRWHTKWPWIFNIGLIGTMMANLVCQCVFRTNGSDFFFTSGSLIRWGWFYMMWMIFVSFCLVHNRFSGFIKRKLRLKATRD